MRDRCQNPQHAAWSDYGGRGITVCERWQTFEHFYADMGDPPVGLSLDRIDNDGNYEPANCRWATRHEQAGNRRSTRLITYAGESLPLAVWAKRMGLSDRAIAHRLKRGWTVEQALLTKIIPRPQRVAVSRLLKQQEGGWLVWHLFEVGEQR